MSIYFDPILGKLRTEKPAGGGGGGVSGSGTTNYVSKFTASGTIGNSQIFDNGTNVGIGTSSPTAKLQLISPNNTSGIYGIKWDNLSASRQFYLDNDGSLVLVGRQTINWANGVSFTAFDINAQTGQIFNVSGSGSGSVLIGTGGVDSSTKLLIRGIDATASNFALKVENSASTPLLYVSNKGNIGNLIAPATNVQFYMLGNGTNDYGYASTGAFNVANFSGFSGTNRTHFYSVNGGQSGFEVDFTNSIAYNRYGVVLNNIGINSSNNIGININVENGVNNYGIVVNNGLSGFGITAPTSKLHIKGIDATSSNYALKIDNSTPTNLFSIRNDGVVDIYGTITPRLQSLVSSATVTPTNLNDEVVITAQAVGLTLANPTGTAVQGQSMIIRIKDNGTAQTIAYDTRYRAIGVTLPTTTVINKIVYLGLIYNSTDVKWDCIGVSQEA
jgi:hypothetical protein